MDSNISDEMQEATEKNWKDEMQEATERNWKSLEELFRYHYFEEMTGKAGLDWFEKIGGFEKVGGHEKVGGYITEVVRGMIPIVIDIVRCKRELADENFV